MIAWRESRIGDEIELAYGKSLPAHAREKGPFGVFGSNGCIGHHSEPLIPGPGIIVGRKGSVGRVVYSEEGFWPIDTTYYVVNKNDHDWRFLYHLLSSIGLDGMNSHSAVPGLNRENAYSIPVRLPAKSEQRKTALALDTIEKSITLEETASEKTTALKRATMRELFTRGLRNEALKETEIGPMPESWAIEPINEDFSVVSGGTPSRKTPAFWNGGTIPWVKTTEVNYGVIRKTEERITQAGLDRSSAKMLPQGTLLLAMYGQGVTRGRVAILGIQATCNQACAAIYPDDDVVDTKYLYHFLSYRYEAIRRLAHGGNQQNLNLETVRNLPLARPANREDQSEIVAILDTIDHKIDLHRRKRAVLDDLFKALLYKLMTGEIGVSDLDLSVNDQRAFQKLHKEELDKCAELL